MNAETESEAIAKGAIAFRMLVDSETVDTIDDYLLVYDFDDGPSKLLTDRWGLIPSAARLLSNTGKRLFTRAKKRSRDQPNAAPFLICHDGDPYPIDSKEQGQSFESHTPIWLIPGIGLQDVKRQGQSLPLDSIVTCWFNCWECQVDTEHQLIGREQLAESEWLGQLIWECR